VSRLALFEAARDALAARDPLDKRRRVGALVRAWGEGLVDVSGPGPEPIAEPGRPARPELVAPRKLVRRRLSTPHGRAALVHAVAHIEFNAINLALDAVYRFRGLPGAYYRDWLQVAADEARHFALMQDRLHAMGFAYGDFAAHDGLWEMARRTADRLAARMALVPRVLEARGLDVTPGMIERLQAVGDTQTVNCLRVILHEEEAHVAIGTRWFHHACQLERLAPEPVFRELVRKLMSGRVRGPLNVAARRRSGFSDAELDWLGSEAAASSGARSRPD